MAEIIVTREGQGVERYLVDKDRMTIGRSITNDIVLEDLSVSRSHAEISVEGGRFFLTDMGSANGSRVNGVSITDTELFHDDVILIGESTLLFVTTQSETEPLPPANRPAEERERAAGESDVAFLTVCCPRQRPQLHAVSLSAIQIGRARDNAIRVVDWFVESYQAQILRETEGFRLVNLSPQTPVFCNQEAVEEVLLQDGDVIQMGMSQMTFAMQDEAAREIETNKGLQPEETPVSGATEYMAYVSGSSEPGDTMKPLDEAATAELDNAIDQVIGDSPLPRTTQEEGQWDTAGESGRPGPSHEPWDRWAEELSSPLPPETEPEPVESATGMEPGETAETGIQDEPEPCAVEPPLPQTYGEEQAFADLEGIIESDGGYRPEETVASEYAPEPPIVPTEEQEAEFLAKAFTPVEVEPATLMEDESDKAEDSDEIDESTPEEPIIQPAFASGTVTWIEEEILVEESENPPDLTDVIDESQLPEEEEVSPPVTDTELPAPADESPTEETRLPDGVDPAKVAFWEKALRNPSPAVVKQALEQLKRLTGRDYDL
jgi:pSer/pThr/pTyr-binding forkhead associated (FHA) protein